MQYCQIMADSLSRHDMHEHNVPVQIKANLCCPLDNIELLAIYHKYSGLTV